MQKTLSLLLALSGVFVGAAILMAQDDPFEQFEQEQDQLYQQFAAEEERAYAAFAQAEKEAYDRFQQQVEDVWGDFEETTKKDWVEYSTDLDTRSKVDFEKGEARVEVLADSQEELQSKLEQAVTELVQDQGKTADYTVKLPDGQVTEPKPLTKKPVLAAQVKKADGTPVTQNNAAEFAKEVTAKPTKPKAITGKDGKKRYKATASFKLVPDHVSKRAEPFRATVLRNAQRFDLYAPMVFAIMHSESYYNPKARSHVPAYGLMQLVPVSGGREAYRHVHKKDVIPRPEYLYDPANNIELGCGYLNYLQTRIFHKVEDRRKAIYCMVSAYNTGAGNVSKAFTGNTRISKAIPLINAMDANDLYVHLRRKLPYEETRGYIKKVAERIEQYKGWQ